MAAHSTFALAQGAAPEVVAALRSGEALPEPKLEALRAFTSELLSERRARDPLRDQRAGHGDEHLRRAA